MENCLVSKLKSVVQNDSLRFLNSVEVYVYDNVETSAKANSFRLSFSKNTRIKIVGDGSFTDSSLQTPATPVKYIDVPANTATDIYFVNGNYKIVLPNADSLKVLWTFASGSSSVAAYKNWYVDLNQFIQCGNITRLEVPTTATTGELNALKDSIQIEILTLSVTSITGDLNELIEYQITEKGRTSSLHSSYFNTHIKVNGNYLSVDKTQVTIIINSVTNYICYIGTPQSYTSFVEYNYINGEWVGGEPVTP